MCDGDESPEHRGVEPPGQAAQRARHRMDEKAAELLFAVKHKGFSWGERRQQTASNSASAVPTRSSSHASSGTAEDEAPIARCEVAPPFGHSAQPAEAAAVTQLPAAAHDPATDDVMRSEVVGALKRKLIELEGERQSAVRRVGLLEQELVIEKRGHQVGLPVGIIPRWLMRALLRYHPRADCAGANARARHQARAAPFPPPPALPQFRTGSSSFSQ